MSAHHPPRQCFSSVDFSSSPSSVVCNFTEGEVYAYDFTTFPSELAGFVLDPSGAYFNSIVRNSIPFVRIS